MSPFEKSTQIFLLALSITLSVTFILLKSFNLIEPHTQLAQVSSTLSDGLVAHYTFDEGSGTTAGDSSGNNNTGTLTPVAPNGPMWVTGTDAKVGSGALQFDGVDDKVDTVPDYIGTGPMTISAWIYPRSLGSLTQGRIIDNGKLWFALRASNVLQFRNANNTVNFSASNSITLNTWQFVTVTRNSQTVNFYINGVLSGVANQTNDIPVAGTRNVFIGGRYGDTTGIFDGSIDDLRIYNRVLTQTEITQLHALGTGGGTQTNQSPTASISASPTSGNTPLIASFNGSNSSDPDGSITTYAWNFGDGTTATGVSTSHTYNSAGTYTATLTITDNQGATGSTNTTITATQSQTQTYSLTIQKQGTGAGTITGMGINCGADCSETVTQGTQITLTAYASSGSIFAGWSGGGCSGTGTCITTISVNTTVTATFTTATQPPSDSGEIISADRRIDWSQAGVPGGIPSADWAICKTLSPSGGDDTSLIQDALNACGNAIDTPSQGKVVFLNPGIYEVKYFFRYTSAQNNPNHRSSVLRNNVVLRGSGPDKTILKIVAGYTGSGNIAFGNVDAWPLFDGSTILPITSGAVKGATSIVVNGADSSFVGRLMHVSELNSTKDSDTAPNEMITVTGIGSGGASDPVADRDRAVPNIRNLQQMVKITGVSGNIVTFTPALYTAYTNAPQIVVVPETVHQVGVEDLKIDNSATTRSDSAYAAIFMMFADQCWIKNVEAAYIRNGFFLYGSLNCEIRDSYIHHPTGNVFQDGSDAGYNQLALSSGVLIENNIFSDLLAPTLYAGSSGNVIGYNFYKNIRAGDITNIISAINTNHGAHGLFNLVEGNTANLFQVDDYYGSSGHGMIFRNNFIGTDAGVLVRQKAISIDAKQAYYSVIGNVLGTPTLSGWTYEAANGSTVPNRSIYRLGYANVGNDSFESWDPQVGRTLLRGGNYDYSTHTVIWQNNAPANSSTYLSQRVLPASLYRNSKPYWFGSIAWPSIGPDVAGYTNKIPAQLCYEQGKMPNCLSPGTPSTFTVNASAGANGGITPTGTVSVNSGSSQVFTITLPTDTLTLSGTASDPNSDPLTVSWSQVSGPSTVTASSLTTLTPTVSFISAGTYILRLTVSDNRGGTAVDDVTITVNPAPAVNRAPIVSAGTDQTITLPTNILSPDTTVSDDNLPSPPTLTILWTKLTGEGTVTFAPNNRINTTIRFSDAGTYTLRLSVSDGLLTSTDDLTVTVLPSPPLPPSDSDQDGVPNSIDLCPSTPPSLKQFVNARGCIKPLATTFDIKPDFDTLDIRSLSNMELGITTHGKIRFISSLNLTRDPSTTIGQTRPDFDSNIAFSRGKVSLNSTSLPELNHSAIITLYNLSLTTPRILKDGVPCTTCTNITYTNNTLSFTVTGFSTYEVVEGTETVLPPAPPSSPTPTQTSHSSSGSRGIFVPTVVQNPLLVPGTPGIKPSTKTNNIIKTLSTSPTTISGTDTTFIEDTTRSDNSLLVPGTPGDDPLTSPKINYFKILLDIIKSMFVNIWGRIVEGVKILIY